MRAVVSDQQNVSTKETTEKALCGSNPVNRSGTILLMLLQLYM